MTTPRDRRRPPARRSRARGLRRLEEERDDRRPARPQTADGHTPVAITLWNGFTRPRARRDQERRGRLPRAHPRITVKVVGGVNDDKIIAAIRGGNAPDVAQSFTADNTGAFCSSGAWIDLKPYMDARRRRATTSSRPRRSTTRSTRASAARCRCSPTPTASTTTRTLFEKAGITRPPKTISELDRRREEAHRAQPRRLAQGRRLRPGLGLLRERRRALRAAVRRASGSTPRASRASSSDPGWAKMLTWQKEPDRLVRLRQAGQVPGRRRRRVLAAERVRDAASSR